MVASADRVLSAPRAWGAFALTFAAYAIAAKLALWLPAPPAIASPFFPAAGIALVASLTWGLPAWLAVGLASAAANAWHAGAGASMPISPMALLGIGLGAALQAALGAAATRRFVGQPMLLAEPAQLARFFAISGVLACCVSASIATAILVQTGQLAPAQWKAHWAAWWIGDTLGVFVFAPITLTLIGRPRSEWIPLRWPVAAPLALTALLMVVGIEKLSQLDRERQAHAFEREAERAATAVKASLLQPLQALEAVRGLVSEAPDLQREAFARAAAPWLKGAQGLRAIGWNERVPTAERSAFEARERAAGLANFRIFERPAAMASLPAAATATQPAGWVLPDAAQVIRFIEPAASNRAALGLDTRSVPPARAAIAQAVRTGLPVVSEGFTLTQGGAGVVIYQAVYAGQPATEDARVSALRGVVFASLEPNVLLRAVAAAYGASLRLCLIDQNSPPASRILAGAPGCDALAPDHRLQVMSLPAAGRQWDLRVDAVDGPVAHFANSWPFALGGLIGTGLLGSLLMVVTGRTRRIEVAVQERTAELEQRSAELQAEVAERQRATAALRDSQQRLRNILDHVPIGVAYTDTSGRIREANPRLREMLGALGQGIGARHIADLLHPEDRPAEVAARERLLQGEVPMARWHLRCLTADDRTLWTQVGVSVLRDVHGEAKRMVWVFEDITEHLALEEAQRARQGADAANQAKSEFLSRMSHELRTPLNAMLGFTQLLELDRRVPLSPHQLEWTGQIRQAGWHLLHMINDTLDLARIESGHVELAPQTLDLREIVADAAALLAHNAQKGNVRIDLRLFDDARFVVGDATRVKQILTNLLSNAIKYNVADGSVLVSSHTAANGQVVLEVSDTGPGMTDAQLAQLFQPFNRLGREAGPIEGTGIGLVISLRLAELMGGALRARSARGEGATFLLELPPAHTRWVPAAPDDLDSVLADAEYRQRIVHYIEDNETNVEVMRGILALRPQVRLEVSMLGLEGLAAVRARKPSLLLLDMHLPDIDGLAMLHLLKRDPETADIPVIVVSADATAARIADAMRAGALHYTTKPVNVAQFLAALDTTLEELDTLFG